MDFKLTKHKIPTPYLVGPVDIFEVEVAGKHLLFDTGPQTEIAQAYLDQHIDLKNLDYLFITHCHPDHYGLARYIEQNSSAQVLLCERDALLFERFEERCDFMVEEIHHMGFSKELILYFEGLIPQFQGDIPFVQSYETLEDSAQLLDDLGIAWMDCPGHSQTDIVYILGNRAITGDTLLRNIWTAPLLDMDVLEGGRFSNYRAYCTSGPKLMGLEGKEILPSHNDWIESVPTQIRFYVEKTLKRAMTMLPLMRENLSYWEMAQRLFPKMLDHHFKLYIKIGEMKFFQDFLEDPQALYQAMIQSGVMDESLEKKFQPFL